MWRPSVHSDVAFWFFNVSSFGEEEAAKVFGGARDYERLSAEEVAVAVLGAVNVADNVQVVCLKMNACQKCTGQKCTKHQLVLCLFFNVLGPYKASDSSNSP